MSWSSSSWSFDAGVGALNLKAGRITEVGESSMGGAVRDILMVVAVDGELLGLRGVMVV